MISLVIPYFSKIIIDRYIIKEGYLINTGKFVISTEKDKFLIAKMKEGSRLDENKYFLFNDKLKFFSKVELDGFIIGEVFSKDKLYLIEKPRNNADINKKIKDLIENGLVIKFNSEKYVFQKSALNSFSFNETIDLRYRDSDVHLCCWRNFSFIFDFSVYFFLSAGDLFIQTVKQFHEGP